MTSQPRNGQTLRQFIKSQPVGSWIAISPDSWVVAIGATAKPQG